VECDYDEMSARVLPVLRETYPNLVECYLNHYFYDDLRHYGSGRNRRIDLQTLKEVAQALEQLEKSIDYLRTFVQRGWSEGRATGAGQVIYAGKLCTVTIYVQLM
jgi:hypothetical protein